MPNLSNFSKEMKETFHSLPVFVQETLMQSKNLLQSQKELENLSRHFHASGNGKTEK